MQSRIPGRNFLFVPGPTNVPDRVQRAMMIAMEDHRSSKFPELSTSVLSDLKKVFKTTAGQRYEQVLKGDKDHKFKAVLACHNQTAGGVDLAVSGRRQVQALKRRRSICVDATFHSLFRGDE